MPTVIDSLVVMLGLDTSKFKQGQKENREDLKKSEENANATAKAIEHSGKTAAAFFSRLRNEALLLFGALAGASGIKQFVENLTTSDANVSRLSKQLDLSTEELTTWMNAAKLTGGSAEQMAGTFQSLEGHIQTFIMTGKDSLIPMFRSMGIAMVTMGDDGQLHARPLRDILLDIAKWAEGKDPAMVAERLRQMGFDQTTITMILKGKDGLQQLLDVAGKLGTTSEQEGKNAEALQQAWAALGIAATDLGRKIVNDLSPYVIGILNQMVDWAAKNREWLESKIHEGVQSLIDKAKELYQYLSTVDWQSVWSTLIEWITQAQLQFQSWFEYLKANWPEIKAGIKDVADVIKAVWTVTDEVVKATIGWKDAVELLLVAWAITKFLPLIGMLRSVLGLFGGITGEVRAISAVASSPAFLAAIAAYAGFHVSQGAGQEELDKEKQLHEQNMRDHPENVLGPTDGQRPDAFKAWWNRTMPTWAGRFAEQKNMADPNQLRDYFLSQGWTNDQVTGILANFKAESGFNAAAVGDNGAAAGLGQWRGDRRELFKKMFGHDLPEATPMEQAEFAQYELTHTEKTAGDALRNTTNRRDAAGVVSRMYERPRDILGQAQLRAQIADGMGDAVSRLNGPSNPARDLQTGAAASPAIQNSTNNTNNTTTNHSSSEVNINGPISIQTQATDAPSIAGGIANALRNSMTVRQADSSLN